MNTNMVRAMVAVASLCASATVFAEVINSNREGIELRPDGKGGSIAVESRGSGQARGKPPATKSNGIDFHGGPVMTNTTNVYYIWYGDWAKNSAQQILADLMNGLDASDIYNINTSYYDAAGKAVVNSVMLQPSVTDNYSLGTSLSDAKVQNVVANAITSGKLPNDPDGVYFVLTSADVQETSGFGTVYCGWHTHANIDGTDIKYAFVGDATTQAPSGCIAVTDSTSPNGNKGADGMASVIYHELSEAVTDPDLNAWYDRRGYENADKCAWKFGATFTAANGGIANVSLGKRDFLLQQNWVNANGGYCSVSY
jgi:hypothetical protein